MNFCQIPNWRFSDLCLKYTPSKKKTVLSSDHKIKDFNNQFTLLLDRNILLVGNYVDAFLPIIDDTFLFIYILPQKF